MPFALLIFAFAATTLSLHTNSWGSPLNVGLIHRQANLDADLTLQQVPRNMSGSADGIVIRWTPGDVSGVLRYSTDYAGETPEQYENQVEDPVESSNGLIRITGSQLPVGYLYCIIDAGDRGYSIIFNIIRVADSAPQMIAPITGAGRLGINSVTPSFRWEAENGVPFYHVIVSDQPFEIVEDDRGTRVEGANVVWQAITSETSIQYGIPDPSEFFDNDQTAPLIGSMNRQDRPRYAWVVLNNYGNHPAYTSTVTGGISGFEVEIEPPFDEPENISPETRSRLDSDEILFRWTGVQEAVSYFVYVSREEITEGGSRALVPAWNAQTTFTSIACPANEVFPNSRFIWKVLAASRQGRGTMSDTSSFFYDVPSGAVEISSRTIGGAELENVQIEVESIDGPGIQSFATDDVGHARRNIAVGTYVFTAVKAGYTDTSSAEITIGEGQRRDLILRLRQLASSIVGTVEDENGQPVSGAVVTASPIPSGDEVAAETNISGAYQIIVPAGNYRINATAAGRRPAEEMTVSVARDEIVDLDADHGPLVLTGYRYTISGYVRNGNGQPINSATVIAVSPDGDERRLYTPETGNYSLLAGQGRWRLNAVKPGFYLESGEVAIDINDRNVETNFTLLPQAGIFSGQVSVDGNPANRNAEVWLIPSAGQITTTGVNQFGAFSRGVSPGDYTVVAVRDGYHTSDSLQLSIDPGETISGLQLDLEANASSISGRITDAGGNALRGARIAASGVVSESDVNGSYSLQVASGSHTVVATKVGYVTAQRGPISVQAGQNLRDLDLRLVDNAGTITGIVRRGNDAIFDAVVTATRQGGDGARVSTRSARDGSYTFGIAFGSYRLTVAKDGFIAAAPGYIDVQLQPGQVVNGRDFPMLAYTSRISGNVSSPAGVINTPSIRITQLDDPNRVSNAFGNVQGDFSVTVVPERRYILTTSKAGFSTESDTTLRLGVEQDTVINNRLTPLPCEIGGTVTVGGQALPDATIRAEGQGGSYQATTSRQGRYAISLQPGQYRITASRPGYTVGESEVRINPGENLGGNDFALRTNFSLVAGVIRDPDGNGISGATVTAIDSINQRTRTAQSDGDGAYQLDGIIPGNYHLIATSNRYRRNTQNLGALLGNQERRGVNLVLQPLSARFTGRVTADGNPVASATVFATEEGGEQFSALTNNDGRFTIDNMSDGVFSARTAKAGYTGNIRANIRVNPADTLTVDLTMVLNNGTIRGFVRDPDGVGLRDVRISAIDSLGNFAATSSNAAGQYALENLYPLTRYRVSPRLNGYTPERDTVRNVANRDTVAFRLLPNELRLSGRVVNQAGQNIAGTELLATSQTDGSTFRATANQAGDFTFTGFSANTRYRIQTQRIEDFYGNADTTVQIGANHLNIGPVIRIIQRTASVRGRITSNNQGVRDAQITTRNLFTGRQRTTYTAADGSYRVTGMRGADLNNYIVRAQKPGFIVRMPDSLTVAGLGLSEERANINFVFDEILISISGRVIDTSGVAATNIPVIAWSETGESRDTTDVNGLFSFTGLFPNQHYSLSTSLPREGYENASMAVDAAQANITGLDLIISRHNATINGLITNDQAAPLNGVNVTLDNVRQISTTADGRYRFEYVAPGDHSLTFSKTGFLTAEAVVNAANGEGEYTRNMTLSTLDRAIFGVISLRDTQVPLPGVVIVLISDAADTLYDTTNNVGQYQFNRLDPLKTYSLVGSRKGYETFTRTGLNVAAGNLELGIHTSPLARRIYGRMLTADDLPVSGAEIRVRSWTNQVLRDTTDFFGDYQVPVEAGTYSIIGFAAPPSTGNSRNYNFVIADTVSRQLMLRLEATGSAVGRLELEDGSPPLSTGRITVSHDATGDVYFAVASNNGEFELPGLRSGHYTLVAEAAGYAMVVTSYPFEALLGETLNLTIVMTQSGKAITGYVLDGRGDGVESARISVAGNTPGSFVTDGQGYWSLPGPLAGRYTVSVVRNGYQQLVDTTFDLAAGGISEVIRVITPESMAISGRLTGIAGAPFEGGKIVLLANSIALDSVTTDRYGEFKFATLAEGRYVLKAEASGYIGNPSGRTIDLVGNGYALDQNFTLSAVRGFGVVRGAIRHGGQPVQTEVSIVDVQNGSRLGVTSNGNGEYSIESIPTPSTFRLVASYPGVPAVSSPSFLLQTNESLTKDLTFPSGQIRVRLLNANENPIVGRRVFITGLNLEYTVILYSDGAGEASTVNWLPAGTYSVTPEAIVGMLPPSAELVDLGADETRQLVWRLGWRLTPPPPFSFEDSARVQIEVPAAVTVSDANLYFRSPGGVNFTAVPLRRDAGRSPGRTLRSVSEAIPVTLEFDATVLYYGYIPPQGRPGTLAYYLEVATADGYIFGGPETVQEVTISARGLLDHLVLTRSQSALQPRVGVPIKISVSGYDDGNNDLTSALRGNGGFEWTQTGEPLGRLVIGSPDSSQAIYYPDEVGQAEIRSRVTQPHTGVTISSTLQWSNAEVSVEQIRVASSLLKLKAGDSLGFTATATDTSGTLIPFAPVWTVTPSVAEIEALPFTMDARIKTTEGLIGKIQVVVTDTISGVSATFNDDSPDRSQHGLAIYGEVRSDNPDTTLLRDGLGFEIKVPPGILASNSIARFYLNEPRLSPVFRLTPTYELAAVAYNIGMEGNLSGNHKFVITFPVPVEFKLGTPTVGFWNSANIDWDVIEGSFNSDSTKVSIETRSPGGLYGLISASEPLGIRDLKFSPNPFSPKATRGGLSIEFRLTSNLADRPTLSVMIYNMQGQLVRKLIDSRLMPKGDYRRGGENQIIWDGLTDNNLEARNGRFIVVLIAKDASGESKVVDSAVLIK